MNFWNPELPRHAGDSATYYGAYGFRLRAEFGIDQLERACQALDANPDGRQVCMAIWDPVKDLPDSDGEPRARDIPCNVMSMLKVREGRLEWTQVMRSNDLWRGLPLIFVQFTVLQEIMAGWLGIEVGTYCHWSDSLHLYEKHLPYLSQVAPIRIPPNTDSLALPRVESSAVLLEVERRLEGAIAPELTESGLRRLGDASDMPQGYRNLLYVALADAARRRHWPDLASELAERGTNPALLMAWERWVARVKRH